MTLNTTAHVGQTEEINGQKQKKQTSGLQKRENGEDGEKSMKPPYEDYCYECMGYGDDYYIDDDGELKCRCPECSFNDWEDDDETD